MRFWDATAREREDADEADVERVAPALDDDEADAYDGADDEAADDNDDDGLRFAFVFALLLRPLLPLRPALSSRVVLDFAAVTWPCRVSLLDRLCTRARPSRPIRVQDVRASRSTHKDGAMMGVMKGLPVYGEKKNGARGKTRGGSSAPMGLGDRPRTPSRVCLLYTSPSPRDKRQSRMPSSA